MRTKRTRAVVAALAVSGALLLLPTAGFAATTFGSRLVDNPANNDECSALTSDPCTVVAFLHPGFPNPDNTTGAPVDGVITRFHIRAFGMNDADATVTFRLANLTRTDPDNALATAVGTGPTVAIPREVVGQDAPRLTFPARLSVRRGDQLAIDGSANLAAVKNDGGNRFSFLFAPVLVQGAAQRASTAVRGELLVAADVEPDADRDGFGDETQDRCLGQNGSLNGCFPEACPAAGGAAAAACPGGPGVPVDRAPPSVGSIAIRGGSVSYTLSEPVTVSFALAKGARGKRANERCVKPVRRNRRRPSCTRFVPVGRSFSGPGEIGVNRQALPRPGGKALAAGTYRLTMTATDTAGNQTVTTKQFRVARPRPTPRGGNGGR